MIGARVAAMVLTIVLVTSAVRRGGMAPRLLAWLVAVGGLIGLVSAPVSAPRAGQT